LPFTFPLGGLLLYLKVITAIPALVNSDNPGQEGCIVGGDLTKLLADFEMKGRKAISTSTQLREILYTDYQDMLLPSSTVASRYYNYCTNSSTSPGNYGY
jgi:hypothetical protein